MTMTAVLDPEGRLTDDDKSTRRQLSASAAPFVPGGGGAGAGAGASASNVKGVPRQWEQAFQNFTSVVMHKNKESERRLQAMEVEMRYLTESRRSDSCALRYDLDVLINKVNQLRSKVTNISNHVRSEKSASVAPSSTPPISALSAQTTPNTTTVSGLSSMSSVDKDPWGTAADQVDPPLNDFDAAGLITSLVSSQHEASPEPEDDSAPHTDLSALFNSVSELNL